MTDPYPLQLPRHLHKDGASTIVHTPDACDAHLADGWAVHPFTLVIGAPDDADADTTDHAAPITDVDHLVVPTKKRKR